MRKLALILFLVLLFSVSAKAQTHSVTLTWGASPTSTVTGYNVYRFIGACSPTVAFTKLTTTPTTALTFTDTTVTAGTTYCYTGTAISPGGESGNAGMFQVTVPTFTASTTPLPQTGFSGTVQ